MSEGLVLRARLLGMTKEKETKLTFHDIRPKSENVHFVEGTKARAVSTKTVIIHEDYWF